MVLTYQDLINDMADGCKPKSEWLIGIEHEQFAFDEKNGTALPYDGDPGIRLLLEIFASDQGWELIYEKENPIASRKDNMFMTLEPGGQVEFSGSPFHTVSEACAEMEHYSEALDRIAARMGIGLMKLGLHPQWSRSDIHFMPKTRYDIMRPYMETKGDHGLDMMLRTCGTQLNIDFGSEEDMVRKFRTAIALQPVIVALMANSSHLEGKDTGYASYRSFIWTDTDPDRCGILPFVFEGGMGFARYVDYALDVPMYFIRRNGEYINVAGQSFRGFMDGKLPGHEGEYPTVDDWHDHLTTIFPEVRLKHFLELRGADSAPRAMIYAMTAFWVGLLYDETALNQAHEIIQDWDIETHQRLRTETPRHGLETKLDDGRAFFLLAEDLLNLSEAGLSRIPQEAESASFLEPFRERLSAQD